MFRHSRGQSWNTNRINRLSGAPAIFRRFQILRKSALNEIRRITYSYCVFICSVCGCRSPDWTCRKREMALEAFRQLRICNAQISLRPLLFRFLSLIWRDLEDNTNNEMFSPSTPASFNTSDQVSYRPSATSPTSWLTLTIGLRNTGVHERFWFWQ